MSRVAGAAPVPLGYLPRQAEVSQDSLHHRRLFNERHEARPPARRGEDAVVENQVDSRPRRQHGEPLEQFQRIKTQVRRPVRPAVPQRVRGCCRPVWAAARSQWPRRSNIRSSCLLASCWCSRILTTKASSRPVYRGGMQMPELKSRWSPRREVRRARAAIHLSARSRNCRL